MTHAVSRDGRRFDGPFCSGWSIVRHSGRVVAFASVVLFVAGSGSRCKAAEPTEFADVTPSISLSERVASSCVECHAGDGAEARLDLEGMLGGPLSLHLADWRKVVRVVREASMPPEEASSLDAADRAEMLGELRNLIKQMAEQHAGDPGPTQVRRLTSAEFDYCLEDLTGLQLGLGEQFLGDGVGGSGFTNSAATQFLQDATLERYLEAAKRVADHAVIGAGPLHFYEASGQTGMELSAIGRIQDLYRRDGFRVSAGEGAKPYGLERFPQAILAAWKYRHRAAYGQDARSLDEFAMDAKLHPKFVRLIWESLNREDARFPLSEIITAWNELPGPGSAPRRNRDQIAEAEADAVAWCNELFQQVQNWQNRFADAASAEEEAAVLTGNKIIIPSHRSFLVRARRKLLEQDDNFTPDLNNPNLYDQDGTVRLRITVEWASPPRQPAASVILQDPTFQYRFLEKVIVDPVPLRSVVTPASDATLGFSENAGGEAIGGDDFIVQVGESKIVEVVLPEDCNLGLMRFEARLDGILGRDIVVRCVIEDVTNGAEGSKAGGQHYSTLLRDQSSRRMEEWESGLTEFAQAFPQISHREPAPSDRDPIPQPYDNTYNVSERNYFHTAVKYHREDEFLTGYLMTPEYRRELDEAWADLLLSFDYHNVNLRFTANKFGIDLPSEQVAGLDAAWIQSLPEQPRQFIAKYQSEFHAAQELTHQAEPEHLADLCRLATKAWRRPLDEAEVTDLHAYYHALRRDDGLTHGAAVRSSIARILVSPEFLFRIEQSPQSPTDQPLSDFELASRLSFSLWSSLPDEELCELAARGVLQDETLLKQQVTRMLKSPKARRMATEFFGQWLGYYQFDRFRGVDQQRFPEFDDALRESLYQEAIELGEYLIRHDRPYGELFNADYAFVDARTAAHYGLDPPKASRGMERVTLQPGQPRGGVLGLGAVLISTSAPLRTSPVKRGDWILRRLLGTPVPPPPADAGSIPADDVLSDGHTVRERLDLHRNQDACRGCHVRIDPLGFALEHFDSLGRWRETYRDGQSIDASGVLESGQTIDGLAGLKSHLREHDEDLRRTLASKLTAYMLGRPESICDVALVDEVMDRLADDPRFSSAVTTIVLSPQFRRIRGSGLGDAHRSTTDHRSRPAADRAGSRGVTP